MRRLKCASAPKPSAVLSPLEASSAKVSPLDVFPGVTAAEKDLVSSVAAAARADINAVHYFQSDSSALSDFSKCLVLFVSAAPPRAASRSCGAER